jgi:carboxylesterase
MNSLPFARYFQTPEHQPFRMEGERGSFLLVHGFPGSPAEMRPLGQALNQAGWAVEGILLPGFGPQVDSLFTRSREDWVAEVRSALRRLISSHRPVIAVGFSMGAALAMQAAAVESADGLVLMAPYWKLPGAVWNLLPVIRRIFPTIQPFRLVRLDFNNADFRRGMSRFMPELDLDDPQKQAELRQGMQQFKLPTGIFDEIRKTGLHAARVAPHLMFPTLVVQGRQDPLVQPGVTRQLLLRLPGPLTYLEVEAAHDLLQPDKPAFAPIHQAILNFATTLRH